MSRLAARGHTVYYVEEEIRSDDPVPEMMVERCETGIHVVTPVLPTASDREPTLRTLLDDFLAEQDITDTIAWFYTPMALPWAARRSFSAVVYDCMDELSAFRFAPTDLPKLEDALMRRADVMFTGGASLFESKRHSHPNIHCEPSGVDLAHFGQARHKVPEPADQAAIAGPKLGYFGVIDERLDLALIQDVARLRPDWNIVMVGPLAKITDADLPRAPNLHWLGGRPYAALPAYLAHWDVALMPFQLNAATRFISPTKAPEYLAGGVRIVSTAIADVVSRYRGVDSVRIAAGAEEFVAQATALLTQRGEALSVEVEELLQSMSWDRLVERMAAELDKAVERHSSVRSQPEAGVVTAT